MNRNFLSIVVYHGLEHTRRIGILPVGLEHFSEQSLQMRYDLFRGSKLV